MSIQTVLHIAPTPFFSDRGCHIRIQGIVRCLDNLGYRNIVCTYHLGKDVSDVDTRRIADIKGYTKTAAGPSPYKLIADLKLLLLAIRCFRTEKPAYIHAHLHEGILIGTLLKIFFFWTNTSLIADIQGSLVGELDEYGSFDKVPFLRAPIKLIEGLLMYPPRKILCSSEHSLQLLCQQFPNSERKLSLVQDGADTPDLLDSRLTQIRDRLNIDESITYIVYSGALLDSKGLTELAEIIELCKPYEDEIHFLIIGYPEENLKKMLPEETLNSLCTLTGRISFEDLSHYLSIGSIAIDPKNSDAGEGSGKLLNYMANGLPVIAFNSINNQQFLGSADSLVNNTAEAHDLLLRLVRSPRERQEFGASNFKRFTSTYSWKATEAQLEKVYKNELLSVCANPTQTE